MTELVTKSAVCSFASVMLAVCSHSPAAVSGELDPASPVIADLVANGGYNQQLCVTAQLILANSDGDDFEIIVDRARGSRFNMEQMATDPAGKQVTVAALIQKVEVDGQAMEAAVSCKMIHRDRINDLFGLELGGPPRSCRNVNEFTYRAALAVLSEDERQAFESIGKALRFADDEIMGAGAQWLPSVVNDFIQPGQDVDGSQYISIQAPSVKVPWDYEDGDWFQGVQSCKLVSVDAMYRWMTMAALWTEAEMFPRVTPLCTEPSSRSSVAGSCILYFGPSGATFCQDFSGRGWTPESAAADCAQRYATQAEWDASEGSYIGSGGVYSSQSCAERDAPAELRGEPVSLADSANRGACVWRCNDADEALWHVMSPIRESGGRSMKDSCELFLQPYW